MKSIRMFAIVICIVLFNPSSTESGTFDSREMWGRLANAGFTGKPMKSAFFFTGSWRDGSQQYEFPAAANHQLYSIHPTDQRHLHWSDTAANRDCAIDRMVEAGVNVVNMSYWGERGLDRWTKFAPMQTSTYSHDELFDATIGRKILIAPYIESTPEWKFLDDFPGTSQRPCPGLVSQIKDLADRYLKNPKNRAWSKKWARMYDRFGNERYIVSIIHVASNRQDVSDENFAAAFDRVAAQIFKETGIQVGFTLDILPPKTNAPGWYKATPDKTGPWLKRQASILAIQCFIPEIWLGISDENKLINWKRGFSKSWTLTGIPFIQDVSPGYDARNIFPKSVIYGNNTFWRNSQTKLINMLNAKGITFNAWNGYTEGFAGVPTEEHGDANFVWAKEIFGMKE